MSNPYAAGTPANQPQTVYVAVPSNSPGFFTRLLSVIRWLLIAFVVVMVFAIIYGSDAIVDDPTSDIHEKYYSGAKDGTHKVVILDIDGVIASGENVRKECEKIRRDEHVKAIVLRVNSPGGTITASDEIYHYLRKVVDEKKIPLVVSMGGIAASGGYYVAMACGDEKDVIFAEPTTWTGSIGVIIPHYNIAGLMEKFQVEEDAIKSAPLKQMGSITRKMTDEERKIFEQLVTEAYDRFKAIVESGRPALRGKKATIDKAATGQVFTTKQALELGLVDKEGFIEQAIDRALELASLDAHTTKVVRYKKRNEFLDALGVAAKPRPAFDVQTLLELTTPRALYLFAWPSAPAVE
jgi:protease-4